MTGCGSYVRKGHFAVYVGETIKNRFALRNCLHPFPALHGKCGLQCVKPTRPIRCGPRLKPEDITNPNSWRNPVRTAGNGLAVQGWKFPRKGRMHLGRRVRMLFTFWARIIIICKGISLLPNWRKKD
ncbi:hypothetical protein CRG98_025965 [Punica granatum]|uniref:Uncharacterized protein n=1 Tax=Punica granatum TaxID=22663 RepID=A0A2I0JBK5_PUNGR|nr:hypothetical protein CRG98_025965 [Punica granatum]